MKRQTNRSLSFLITALAAVLLGPLGLVSGFGQNAGLDPAQATDAIATLDLRLEKVLELLPAERPKEAQLQIDTIRETGLQTIRLALVPDKKRIVFPVIKITGDMEALNETLTDPTSPLRIIATPVGDDGLYQFPTSEKDPLQLKLHKSADALVFAPLGLPEATRAKALAAAPIAFKPEYAAVIDGNFPEKLDMEWFKPLIMQNLGVLGEDGKDENIDFGISMMAGMLEGILKPFDRTERVTGGVFILPSGHRVFDWQHTFRDPASATHATTVFNTGKGADGEKPKKLGKGISKTLETAFRSKAVQEGNMCKSRVVWNQEDDEKMMKVFSRHIMGSLMGGDGMEPAEEPVPTTKPVPVVDFSAPYDADKLASELSKTLPNYIWYKQTSLMELDSVREPNANLVKATFTPLSVISADGKELLVPPEGDQSHERSISLVPSSFTHLRFPTDSDQKERPATGRGRIVLQIPEQRHLITIPAGTEEWATFKAGENELTVELLQNDVAIFSLDGGRFGPIQALDKEGRALSTGGRSWNKEMQSIKYKGSVAELQVVILSEETREVPVEFDVAFKKATWGGSRERYLKKSDLPKAHEPLLASDFDNLKVTFTPKNEDQGVRHNTLDVPLAKPGMQAHYEIQGFGPEGPVKIRGWGNDGTKAQLWSETEKCGLIYGEVTVSGPIEGTVIEVQKTTDGAAVPFEVHGESGTVTFNSNTVVISKAPSGIPASIKLYRNAKGLPLRSNYQGRCYGIPTSVQIFASKKVEKRTLPFSFEIGPYDKENLAAHKLSRFIQPSPKPVPTTDPVTELKLDIPYQADQFAAELKRVIPDYVWMGGFRQSTLSMGNLDPVQVPDASLVTATFTATSVLTTTGTEILRKTGKLKSKQFSLSQGSSFDFPYEAEKGKSEVGRGHFMLEIPETKNLISIPAGTENGKNFTAGEGSLSVELIKNDVVALTIESAKFGRIQALDQQGRALKINDGGKADRFGGFGRRDEDQNLKELRFHGTIHELQVELLSEATRSVKVEAELEFEKKIDDSRERYLNPTQIPQPYAATETADYANLTVKYLPKGNQRYNHFLDIPFPEKRPDIDVKMSAFGFATNGQGSVVDRFNRPETGVLTTRINEKVEKSSVLFGEAILRCRTGNRQITVSKTADQTGEQAKVPFEVEGHSGIVSFDGATAKITRMPKGSRCTITSFHNADGLALRSYNGKCMGHPSSVQIQAATGIETHRIPFEIEIDGDYDKAAYAAYKNETLAKTGGKRIRPSAESVATTYPANPVDLSAAYDAEVLAKQLNEQIQQHLWFVGIHKQSDKDQVGLTLGRAPDSPDIARHISATLQPISAVNSNGVDVLKKQDSRSPTRSFKGLGDSHYLTFDCVRGGNPVKGTNRITIAMPAHMETLTIPANDDQTFLLGYTELTVSHIENDVAQLWLTKGGTFAGIQALDIDGQALTRANGEDDPEPSNKTTTQYLRYKGTIHQLQVRVRSDATKPFPFEFETAFAKMTIEEAIAAGREKYLSSPKTRAPNIEPAVLDKLAVTWNEKDKEKRIYNPFLDVAFPTPAPEHHVWYSFYGFGTNGIVRIPSQDAYGTKKESLYSSRLENVGVLFGEATITGPADVRYLELDKVADGEPVPFTINDLEGKAQACELVFDKTKVTINTRPKHGTVSLFLLKNAKGQNLDSSSGKAWGIPTKVVLYTSAGKVKRTIPFEFELGDYDKAGLATYKEQLKIMAAFGQLKKASSTYSPVDTLAGFYYLHGGDDKPQHLIPEELAHADPYGAELFGYETKPYLGYNFVACTTWAKTDKPLHSSTREYDMKWDGGELKLKRARHRYFNAVPVDPSKPTLYFDGYETHAKNLGEQPEGSHYRLVPDAKNEEKGWKSLGRMKN